MEFLKKYWWAVLLAPVVLYFMWEYYKAQKANTDTLAKAREAKANKAILRTEEPLQDVGQN